MMDEPRRGTPLLQPCMRNGRRRAPPATLQACRELHAAQRRLLPERLRTLATAPAAYEAQVSERVRSLTAALDAATA
jgi:nicotinate phosphoribosyltransferase